MTNSEVKLALGTIGIFAAAGAYIFTANKRNAAKEATAYRDAQVAKVKQAEIDAQMPAEYWTAKQAEIEASVEKHRITTESQERLKLDEREREDATAAAKREFEQNAPDGYWAAKKAEEEEKTRRHQMDLDDKRRRDQVRADQALANRQAEALENSAKAIERAFTGRVI